MAGPGARRMYICEMMDRMGIERGEGVVARLGLTYAVAFRRCAACASKQACREWLDRTPPWMGFVPRFCPNTDIFHELRLNQLGRRSVI